ADVAPSIGEVAQHLGVHRSAAYRLLRTLEAHYLVRRDEAGKIHPAAGLTNLARGVENSLQAVGLPVMTKIADELGRSEEHTSELQSRFDLVCRLLLEKKKNTTA